ncbi:MAG: alpha-ketoacid dehydrogenase subunit beta [Pseudomonadota bacterium]
MTHMTMVQAINSALDNTMDADPMVMVMGEDVGFFGGVFRCTEGLYQKYGAHRALDTPIAEGGIVAAAIGMSLNGVRPVVEMQFADYIYPAFDQIVSELARIRHRSGGEFFTPVTVRSPCGGGIRGGQTHSQSPEAMFTHVCGLKTVMPSTPYDAKGLLISAIEDDDPVIFFEPKRIYNGPFYGHRPDEHASSSGAATWEGHPGGDVPEGPYRIPLGKANVLREGRDVTVLAYGTMVHVAEAAIDASGADVELLDLRSLLPLDLDAIVKSVRKTGRCVIVHEATRTSGFGAELSSVVQEECFWHLQAPIERVTGWDTPYPHAFEWEYFPSQKRINLAVERVLSAN